MQSKPNNRRLAVTIVSALSPKQRGAAQAAPVVALNTGTGSHVLRCSNEGVTEEQRRSNEGVTVGKAHCLGDGPGLLPERQGGEALRPRILPWRVLAT